MTPGAFKARLEAHGFTQEAFAKQVGKTLRQVNRYATGATPIPKAVQMLLEGKKLGGKAR